MLNAQKFLIKTSKNRTYSLHIIDANEYDEGKYVGLFLYYDDESDFQHLRHRLLFENSIDAIKDKVIEYANGRGEEAILEENGLVLA
jgi:hypothetical protein